MYIFTHLFYQNHSCMKLFQLSLLTCCLLLGNMLAAQRIVSGTVTSDSGEPLIGATVKAQGTTRGTLTDIVGHYQLEVPPETTTLVFSYTGSQTLEISLGTGETVDAILAEGYELNDVVVIGSRSATRTKLTTAVPVDVIPIQNVVNEVGQVDLNQILTYVAPSFQSSRQAISDGTDHVDPAQLRGLGPDQVLVLVNGKRRHQSALVNVNGTVNRGTVGTDLNAIPATAVERIEILRDGAAAQYGSDAIAGVINIVTKRKTGLLDVSASAGQYFTTYDKNFAYNKINNIAADPSVDVQDGLTYQGGANYGFNLGKKGFVNLTGEYSQRGATNRTGLYTGQIYPRNGAGQISDDSILGAKRLTRDHFDMRIGNSEVKSGGAFLNAGYELSEGWEIYLFGGYNKKQGNAAGFYRYPTGIPASSNARSIYPDGFLPNINSDVTDISGSLGVRGKIGGWSADLSQTFGRNEFDFSVSNSVNYTQSNIEPGNIQREFEAGGLSFQQLTTNLDLAHEYKVLSGLNVALGGEYRIDEFEIVAGEEASYKNYNTAASIAAGAQVFSGFQPQNAGSNSRNSAAGYLDIELDLTSRFLVGGAVRFENYSDFGQTVNYKAVARYRLSDYFTLRASTSTGFRAPSQQQKYYAKTNTLFVNGPNGLQPVESGTFTNDSRPAEIFGIPDLKEETSVSYAGGISWRPTGGLELTVDAYQIDIDDRIVLTNNFSAGGNAEIAAQLAAAGATTANFFSNAVNTRSSGVEAVLAYTTRFENKQELRLVLAGTYIDNEVKKGANGKPIIKSSDILESTGQVGSYFNREDQSRIEVANPRTKASLTINYKAGPLSFMLRNAYWGKVEYLDPINFNDQTTWPKAAPYYTAATNTYNPVAFKNAFTGLNETFDQTFSPKVVTDLTVTYQLFKQISVAVGANNLFDVYQDRHLHSNNVSLGRFVYSRRVQQMGFNGRYMFARLRFTI